MRISRAVAVVLCLGAHLAIAQNSAPATVESSCFRISVDLDDTPVPDSLNVYVIQKDHTEKKLSQVDGCFRVPTNFNPQGKVGVRIDLEQDSLLLSNVSAGYLGRPWTIALSDKTELVTIGAKRYKASQVCQVLVHGGDPEIGFVSAPCRSPRRPLRKH